MQTLGAKSIKDEQVRSVEDFVEFIAVKSKLHLKTLLTAENDKYQVL